MSYALWLSIALCHFQRGEYEAAAEAAAQWSEAQI